MILEGLVRLLSWFIRIAGAWTILVFTLLLILAQVLVWVLETSIRGLEDSWLPVAASLGLLLGWGLARSKLNSWQSALLGGVAGLGAALFQLGRLGGPISRLIASLPLTKGRSLGWEGLPDLSLLLSSLRELWSGANIPLARLIHWASSMVNGEPAYDPTAIVLFWSLIVWMISAWQSWVFRRHSQALPSMLPAGALIAITIQYTGQSTFPIAGFLAGTLLLFSLVEFRKLVNRWESSGTDYSEDIRFEMSLASLILVISLTFASVLTPSVSIQQLSEWARRAQAQESEETGQFAESFGLRPRPWQKPPFADFSSPGLPRSHLLGSGPELSEQVVMVVQVGKTPAPSGTPQPPPLENPRWRGLTYDRYSGHGWVTAVTEIYRYPAGEVIYRPDFPMLLSLEQTTRLYLRADSQGKQLLYAAGNLLRVDQEAEVAWRSNQDVFGILGTQASYRAVSAVIVASEDLLRESGQDYPGWVRERYLSLPESVPARVLGLGRDLTGTAPTPFDRALAIEQYLRTIPYSLDVPVPPPDRDVSDFFLFDLRRGYCDYYATAMVVLARAAGLPARLVTGFASGQYDPGSSSFIVSAADAHTWVEVFFPAYGWIEFEPTAGRSPIIRSGENFPEVAAPEGQVPETFLPPPAAPPWKTLILVLTGLLFALLAGFVLWQIYDEWALRRLPPSGAVTSIYHRLFQESQHLDGRIHPADTPFELARKLGDQLVRLDNNGKLHNKISPGNEEVVILAEAFAKAAYSPRLPSQGEREQAVLAWRKLHWRLWLARLVSMRGGKRV